jgi:hypothetical protein
LKGPNDFRNPSEDLPSDWSDEQCRTLHYQALGKPLDAQAFVRLLRTRMEAALTNFNRVLPDLNHLRIFRPRQNDDRGLWALAKLERQPEPPSLGVIKEKIGSGYGMLDLLDVFVEADRLWSTSRDFSRILAHGRSAPAFRGPEISALNFMALCLILVHPPVAHILCFLRILAQLSKLSRSLWKFEAPLVDQFRANVRLIDKPFAEWPSRKLYAWKCAVHNPHRPPALCGFLHSVFQYSLHQAMDLQCAAVQNRGIQ